MCGERDRDRDLSSPSSGCQKLPLTGNHAPSRLPAGSLSLPLFQLLVAPGALRPYFYGGG